MTDNPNQVDIDSIHGTITAYKAVDAQIKSMIEARDNLRRDIETALGDHDTGLLNGRRAVTWRHTKKPERFDLTAFRRAHPELAAEYTSVREAPRVFKVL